MELKRSIPSTSAISKRHFRSFLSSTCLSRTIRYFTALYNRFFVKQREKRTITSWLVHGKLAFQRTTNLHCVPRRRTPSFAWLKIDILITCSSLMHRFTVRREETRRSTEENSGYYHPDKKVSSTNLFSYSLAKHWQMWVIRWNSTQLRERKWIVE